jgi:hypothetical protein
MFKIWETYTQNKITEKWKTKPPSQWMCELQLLLSPSLNLRKLGAGGRRQWCPLVDHKWRTIQRFPILRVILNLILPCMLQLFAFDKNKQKISHVNFHCLSYNYSSIIWYFPDTKDYLQSINFKHCKNLWQQILAVEVQCQLWVDLGSKLHDISLSWLSYLFNGFDNTCLTVFIPAHVVKNTAYKCLVKVEIATRCKCNYDWE